MLSCLFSYLFLCGSFLLHHFIHRWQSLGDIIFFNINGGLLLHLWILLQAYTDRYFFIFDIAVDKKAVPVKLPGTGPEYQVFGCERLVIAVRVAPIDIYIIISSLFKAICVKIKEEAVEFLGLNRRTGENHENE